MSSVSPVDFAIGALVMYEWPQSKISVTVPVNHVGGPVLCLLGKTSTHSFALSTHRSFALCALLNCSFYVFCISMSLCWIWYMLIGLEGLEMTAPCTGCLWRISAGEGRSVKIGVSHNWSSTLAWAFGYPSVFLQAFLTFFTMASMKPLDWWKWGNDVVCMKLNSQANLLNSSPLNGGPLSDITMAGMPSAVRSSQRWLMVLIWCADATGKTYGSLLKLSSTIKYLLPWWSWKKSIPILTQGPGGTSLGCNVSMGRLLHSIHIRHLLI